MPKFNTRVFTKDVTKSLNSREMKDQMFKVAQDKVEQADKRMIKNFESHPVTKEIDGGADASNLSGTLGGYGNLFSFIGFNETASPTDIIRSYISKGTKVYKNPRVISQPSFVQMSFRIEAPNVEEIESMTPSPWEGKSWVRGVERGISGLGYYINEHSPNSRSGKGYQSSKKIRSLIFKPVKYISSILEQFYKEVK